MKACIINTIVFVNGFKVKWQYSVSEDGRECMTWILLHRPKERSVDHDIDGKRDDRAA